MPILFRTTHALLTCTILVVFSLLTCSNDAEAPRHPDFPYLLDEPEQRFDLPAELVEISGLSMCGPDMLAAVNDEQGIIFLLDKHDGKVLERVRFWEGGDYEGIEVVGEDAFVIKSNGNIYEVRNFRSGGEPQVLLHGSFLGKDDDVEALGFWPSANVLLVGCKGLFESADHAAPARAIFAFDLESRQLQQKPIFLIDGHALRQALLDYPDACADQRLLSRYVEEDGEFNFSPSGIAVHPLTGDIYVLSSKGKQLVVLTPEGQIRFVEKLDKKWHPQPEGICFDTDGTLYISNEGRGGRACIYRFSYRN